MNWGEDDIVVRHGSDLEDAVTLVPRGGLVQGRVVPTPNRLRFGDRRQTCLFRHAGVFRRTEFGAVDCWLLLSLLVRNGCRGLHLGELSIVLLPRQVWVLARFAFFLKRTYSFI